MAPQSVITPARRARHRLRARVSGYPAVYLSFARHKYPGPSPEVIGAETELVIDGYTRSATTFAVYAFQLCQDRPVRLAHHLHAPAQLIAASRAGVPALLLIREPAGAVLSQVIREPGVAVRDALVAWIRFHECLHPYLGDLVVGEFKQVTSDFGTVIRRLNERFGTSFREFTPTEAAVRECFELIRYRGTLAPGLLGFESGTVTREQARSEVAALAREPQPPEVTQAWLPSGNRDRSKEALRAQWGRPGLARLRDRAQRVYSELQATARTGGRVS